MTTSSAPDFDPIPPDREWFRHETRGDRGYRVRRNGKDMIRLDRPMQELLEPLTGQWKRDEYGSLFLHEQISRVAFQADRGMCALVGLHPESRVTWQDLPDKQRTEFIRNGPPEEAHPARRVVYEAIFKALEPYTTEKR